LRSEHGSQSIEAIVQAMRDRCLVRAHEAPGLSPWRRFSASIALGARRDPRFKHAFEALTPGRRRSYLYHFAAAKRPATRVARLEKATPAIFEGRGFLERR